MLKIQRLPVELQVMEQFQHHLPPLQLQLNQILPLFQHRAPQMLKHHLLLRQKVKQYQNHHQLLHQLLQKKWKALLLKHHSPVKYRPMSRIF